MLWGAVCRSARLWLRSSLPLLTSRSVPRGLCEKAGSHRPGHLVYWHRAETSQGHWEWHRPWHDGSRHRHQHGRRQNAIRMLALRDARGECYHNAIIAGRARNATECYECYHNARTTDKRMLQECYKNGIIMLGKAIIMLRSTHSVQ